MSTEKPNTMLAKWEQYLEILLVKGLFYCICISLGTLGLACLIGSAMALRYYRQFDFIPFTIVGLFIFVGVSLLRGGTRMFKGLQKALPPVKLITRHNTGCLPEVQSLVRASDRPAVNPPTELLRAAGEGAETPAEQLLRATPGNGQDV